MDALFGKVYIGKHIERRKREGEGGKGIDLFASVCETHFEFIISVHSMANIICSMVLLIIS